MQKISRQYYCLQISPMHLIPLAEKRLSKYIGAVTTIMMLCKNTKWFDPLMATPSSTLSLESCNDID